MRGKNLSEFLVKVESTKQTVVQSYPEINEVLDKAHSIRRERKEEKTTKKEVENVR